MLCPKCNAECWRDEVEIGVGVQFGPWNCPECGWSEGAESDEMYIPDGFYFQDDLDGGRLVKKDNACDQ